VGQPGHDCGVHRDRVAAECLLLCVCVFFKLVALHGNDLPTLRDALCKCWMEINLNRMEISRLAMV
jgi:hypothetical protein